MGLAGSAAVDEKVDRTHTSEVPLKRILKTNRQIFMKFAVDFQGAQRTNPIDDSKPLHVFMQCISLSTTVPTNYELYSLITQPILTCSLHITTQISI